MHRRNFIQQLSAYIAFGSTTLSLPATANNSDKANFQFRMPSDLSSSVVENLDYQGTTSVESDTKGLPLITIIVGIALLPSLVDAILRLRARLVQPGILIDTRTTQIRIETSPTIPKGSILIVSKEATSLLDSSDVKNSADLIKALTSVAPK